MENYRNIETCHYTYITTFKPTAEEVCEENFDKQCSITFTQKAFNETVRKCYKPVDKVCDGTGPEVCQVCPNFKMYLSKLQNVFESILKVLSQIIKRISYKL